MSNLSPPADDIAALFKPDLQSDEKILWTGQPESKLVIKKSTYGQAAAAIVFGIAALCCLPKVNFQTEQEIFLAFAILGGDLLILAFYLLIGKNLVQSAKHKSTRYAVSNQRVFVLHNGGNGKIQSIPINKLPALKKLDHTNGVGSITFEDSTKSGSSSSLKLIGAMSAPGFYEIPQVDDVYDLIAGLKN